MMSTVTELVEDVGFKIGDPDHDDVIQPVILRAMNRIYQSLNMRYLCLEAEFSISAGNLSSTTIFKAVPADWIRMFRMSPKRDFRAKEVFLDDEDNTFSVYRSRVYIANASATSAFTIGYFSSGLVLLDEGSAVADVSVKTPEWPTHHHQTLLYATALEVSKTYPGRVEDANMLLGMKMELSKLRNLHDLSSPSLSGPQVRGVVTSDPYL